MESFQREMLGFVFGEELQKFKQLALGGAPAWSLLGNTMEIQIRCGW